MEFLNGVNALVLVFAAVCIFAIAYRFYGIFLANKVFKLDASRKTPAIALADGHDYVATNRTVLFGHHFAAIAAAGPLLGPVLAAQFGFLPGTLWILVGCVLAGGVHDAIVLFASVRHKGQSLAAIASKEIGKVNGILTAVAVLFIMVLALSGLSIACINALYNAPWSLFIVSMTVPIAIVMGLIMKYHKAKNAIALASLAGLVMLLITIIWGNTLMRPEAFGGMFTWSKTTIAIVIPLFGFAASVLPVWIMLLPRDYLSTYLKIGTIVMLAVGIIFVHPQLKMPALTDFIHGGGPIISGKVFPFIFITIACGAISGFHAVIAAGTTPKMLSNEREVLFVGYGAMLTEGFVAIMALIAACVLVPGDYFAINTPKALHDAFVAANPAYAVSEIQNFIDKIGIDLYGRTGGAVSLAVGMAYVFGNIPFMDKLTAYWYNFAIMFEAVFILAALDGGTRVGRFFLQELFGKAVPKFNDKNWVPGIIITSAIFSGAWGYLAYSGDISSVWPLFGLTNQLLATGALLITSSLLIRLNRGKYALCSVIPGIFMLFITFWAGYLQVFEGYFPKGQILLGVLGLTTMILMLLISIGVFKKWIELIKIKTTLKDEFGDDVKELV
ncbi:MAG: carbon starvation protein A [Elusimicrobiota bacterium]|nr:carbon starvation protein A [Elusimicrobiota bacterium]